METSPRRGDSLRAVRLGDIPIEIRLRAARQAVRTTTPDDKAHPADRLLGRLRADHSAGGDSTAYEALKQVAENPSRQVYFVRREAYERVMLPKNRRTP